jgi:hypothetical protein
MVGVGQSNAASPTLPTLFPRATVTHTMPLKRPADDADVETAIQAAGIKDDDWIQKLLESTRDNSS